MKVIKSWALVKTNPFVQGVKISGYVYGDDRLGRDGKPREDGTGILTDYIIKLETDEANLLYAHTMSGTVYELQDMADEYAEWLVEHTIDFIDHAREVGLLN